MVFFFSCFYFVCIIMVMVRLKNGIIGVKLLKFFLGYFSGVFYFLGGKVFLEISGIF